jgi:hypothetical protein
LQKPFDTAALLGKIQEALGTAVGGPVARR